MDTVTLLMNCRGETVAIYADASDAEARAAKFNADPFIDGEPDGDAPYTTESWKVQP